MIFCTKQSFFTKEECSETLAVFPFPLPTHADKKGHLLISQHSDTHMTNLDTTVHQFLALGFQYRKQVINSLCPKTSLTNPTITLKGVLRSYSLH